MQGAGVSPGVGSGPVRSIAGAVPEPPAGARHGGDAAAETDTALAALEAVAADLEERGERAAAAGNDDGRDVLNAQALMARDPGLADGVRGVIGEGTAAARAVFEAFGVYREMLAGAGEYMAARVTDLDDIRDRAIARLLGLPVPGVPESDEPFVLVARDLAPADTAVLDPAQVVAFVTEEGGPTSHTAIIARTMGVPAVVALKGATSIADGTRALVDGAAGTVLLDPSDAEVSAARAAADARASALRESTGPGATRDGHAVPLLANIGGPKDVEAALANGAEGVGLYRTEFLFLDRATPPSDAEQEEAYRKVLEAFPEGRVVVRTLDAGADKPLAFLPAPGDEPNPALGERGLRMMRLHPDVLSAQLSALARAAAGLTVKLQVMAPMVTDAAEAAFFAAACREAGIEHPGVMIEVPAAALRARDLAPEVEFFSIGTNDLTQYACAADRQIGGLAHLQDPWQPAVLDLVAPAAGAGVSCGVCGEAAGDPVLACVLVGLGVTSLSMSAPSLPLVRAALARHTLDECREAAAAARAARSAGEAEDAARARLPGLADLGL
ncbi:phosphoenolpyruvate--protein phosphotransferase [Actinomadura madurae]|uniref:phosphoenolpyruvate--protein phosphotransferase n=1 Tax=Actinomadura madurae TaxID=1993 RepID=UPI002025DE41|nr:phosphoenolpyruvate--protein phosphotransferase [Actinomadura madurae]MCP9967286.1 phosphoenolpyruvate--protein phosphotransferase [Actinomadura madurae]MCP9979740.1 phosphoenolpyruvate--protein phosphotransferase [Actinomadura madurae]MCQ0015951.1 phosphoenolpyruvate--protein phosphotransferase [Actinomadura madurae]URN10710.1 phosphoenolpyruvate--protein phosphotransferase [Actinomadura madurae]